MTNKVLTTMNHEIARKEAPGMDAWTELTQAAIRDRIREREVDAAGERLASIARSAAVVRAAVRLLVDAARPSWTEPTRLDRAPARAR